MDFQVGRRRIGPGNPCFIIAEVGLAHDGSMSAAHAYIDACAASGADAVKFQCHTGDSTTEWRVKPDWCQDASRQDYWTRTAFTAAQWQELARHCAMAGVEFLCSVFSDEAVAMLNVFVAAWKLPSGRLMDTDILDAIRYTRKPVLLSTGMSSMHELQYALKYLANSGCVTAVLQCTSLYPCPPSQVGLPLVAQWSGLSDHSGTIYPGIAAAALGCQVLEVHVCWSKEQHGLDAAASITMQQLRELVRGVRFVEAAMQPVDKDAMAEQLSKTRRVFMGVA